MDLSKAFDTVDHIILLRKLKLIGLESKSLTWFESYLSNRLQKTSINNTLSSSLPVSVGVLQGSILSPLLFIIYVNELPNIVKHCKITLYDDDTLLYYSSNSPKDIEQRINEDLVSICKWLDVNLLTLNCAKSKFLLFGSNRRLKSFTNVSIHVNNQQLAREQSFKYLGINFSENLNWSDYLSDVSTKINQRIGLLRRVKALIPLKDRLTIYNSLILLDYADIIWGKNNCNLMDQLQILQNKDANTILDALSYPPPLKLSQIYTGTHLPTGVIYIECCPFSN